MATFFCFCAFILGSNYLFAVSAQSVEDEILYGSKKNTIVGGRPISINKAPYLAQLVDTSGQFCGSTILNEYWLVTASHCVDDRYFFAALTGTSIRGLGGTSHEIAGYIMHEGYNVTTSDNDIALIKLTHPIKFNSGQKPISILKKSPIVGDHVTIVGFGRIGTKSRYSRVLKRAVVPVVSKRDCKRVYLKKGGDILTPNMFCAFEIGKRDTCFGDSGGPAVVNGKLGGIVSFGGEECASLTHPGVYTKIANYRDWIKEYTGLEV